MFSINQKILSSAMRTMSQSQEREEYKAVQYSKQQEQERKYLLLKGYSKEACTSKTKQKQHCKDQSTQLLAMRKMEMRMQVLERESTLKQETR